MNFVSLQSANESELRLAEIAQTLLLSQWAFPAWGATPVGRRNVHHLGLGLIWRDMSFLNDTL
jgi:hypothetical protein